MRPTCFLLLVLINIFTSRVLCYNDQHSYSSDSDWDRYAASTIQCNAIGQREAEVCFDRSLLFGNVTALPMPWPMNTHQAYQFIESKIQAIECFLGHLRKCIPRFRWSIYESQVEFTLRKWRDLAHNSVDMEYFIASTRCLQGRNVTTLNNCVRGFLLKVDFINSVDYRHDFLRNNEVTSDRYIPSNPYGKDGDFKYDSLCMAKHQMVRCLDEEYLRVCTGGAGMPHPGHLPPMAIPGNLPPPPNIQPPPPPPPAGSLPPPPVGILGLGGGLSGEVPPGLGGPDGPPPPAPPPYRPPYNSYPPLMSRSQMVGNQPLPPPMVVERPPQSVLPLPHPETTGSGELPIPPIGPLEMADFMYNWVNNYLMSLVCLVNDDRRYQADMPQLWQRFRGIDENIATNRLPPYTDNFSLYRILVQVV